LDKFEIKEDYWRRNSDDDDGESDPELDCFFVDEQIWTTSISFRGSEDEEFC